VNKTTTNIFDSHNLARLVVPNRIAMAPLTRSRAANDIAGGMNAFYYTQRTDVFPTSSR
jgi:2,4-dienoyl-CoA reductase-like NADH-dependent reductase (Old Yellow Enzyme family)